MINRSRYHLFGFLASLFAMIAAPGCSYMLLLGYLISGPPTVEPDFDRLTKESLSDYGVKVAVVCFAPTEVRYGFEDIDSDVAKYVAYRLHEHKIKVVNPDMVKAWMDQNKNWDSPEELGKALEVTHVIYIDLNRFTLYEDGSVSLYRGKAEAIASVWKINKDENAEKIFSKEVISKYPAYQPKSAAEQSYGNFKSQYLSRLSDEIGHLFYEYYAVDELDHNA